MNKVLVPEKDIVRLQRVAEEVAAELDRLREANAALLAACWATSVWFDKFYITHSVILGATELAEQVNNAIAKAEALGVDDE